MSKKLSNKKNFCIILIIFILLIIVVLCIKNKDFFLIKKEKENETQNNIETVENENSSKKNNENLGENDTKYSSVKSKYNNDDFVGSIKISGANIEEPVFKAKDNDYYLTHNGYKEEDRLGAIYLDYRFSFDTSKKKIQKRNKPMRKL